MQIWLYKAVTVHQRSQHAYDLTKSFASSVNDGLQRPYVPE